MKKITFSLLGTVAVIAASMTAGAATLNLITAGSSGFVNGGFFQQVPDQTTGTGVIEPFLRLQGNGTESGLNTSLSSVLGDTKTGIWTHDILLSAVPIVTIGGIQSYQFLLDINQNTGGSGELLSLNKLEIWTKQGTLPEANSYNDLAAGGATQKWSLDGAGNSTIELNYQLNPGSGAGDMFAYIPLSVVGPAGTLNLYLYTEFGDPNTSNDGFEEWAVLKAAGTNVPDAASTMALFGMGLMAFGAVRRKLS